MSLNVYMTIASNAAQIHAGQAHKHGLRGTGPLFILCHIFRNIIQIYGHQMHGVAVHSPLHATHRKYRIKKLNLKLCLGFITHVYPHTA